MKEASVQFVDARQLCVLKTNRTVFEMKDQLQISSQAFAKIHKEKEETENGKDFEKDFRASLIQLVMIDYSNAKKHIRVTDNLNPSQVRYLYEAAKKNENSFSFTTTKIFGEPDQDGLCTVRKLFITRQEKNEKEEVMRNPWSVLIENGRGIKLRKQNGSSSIQGNSYRKEKSAYIKISDKDFFYLFDKAASYIRVWENTFGPKHLHENQKYYELLQKENENFENKINAMSTQKEKLYRIIRKKPNEETGEVVINQYQSPFTKEELLDFQSAKKDPVAEYFIVCEKDWLKNKQFLFEKVDKNEIDGKVIVRLN